jgi:hypothetical protein
VAYYIDCSSNELNGAAESVLNPETTKHTIIDRFPNIPTPPTAFRSSNLTQMNKDDISCAPKVPTDCDSLLRLKRKYVECATVANKMMRIDHSGVKHRQNYR